MSFVIVKKIQEKKNNGNLFLKWGSRKSRKMKKMEYSGEMVRSDNEMNFRGENEHETGREREREWGDC